MSDADKIKVLKKLNDHKLMDVVKNYKQYGYSESTENVIARMFFGKDFFVFLKQLEREDIKEKLKNVR